MNHSITDIPIPGTVREEFPTRDNDRVVIAPKHTNSHGAPPPPPSSPPLSVKPLPTIHETTTKNIHNVILNAHPQDNEIAGSVNIRTDQAPNVNIPFSVDSNSNETYGARLNLGAIVALAAFGGFVFLAAIITTVVVLVRR